MDALDLRVLQACEELVLRKQEVGVLLAGALGVSPEWIFYTWMNRKCEQIGSIPGTDWKHFFHGCECELKNEADGRHLRYDFGPRGRLDTVSGSAVSSFVKGSKHPWKEFPDLRQQLGDDPVKAQDILDRLERLGYFEPADPKLCALRKNCTQTDPDSITRITFPKAMSWEAQVDVMVARRPVFSSEGRKLLGGGEVAGLSPST